MIYVCEMSSSNSTLIHYFQVFHATFDVFTHKLFRENLFLCFSYFFFHPSFDVKNLQPKGEKNVFYVMFTIYFHRSARQKLSNDHLLYFSSLVFYFSFFPIFPLIFFTFFLFSFIMVTYFFNRSAFIRVILKMKTKNCRKVIPSLFIYFLLPFFYILLFTYLLYLFLAK